MSAKYTISCALVKPDKYGALLQIRIKWNGNVVAMNTGHRVNQNKFDREEMRCKRGSSHGKRLEPSSTINADIERIEAAAATLFTRYDSDGRSPLPDNLRSEMKKMLGKEDRHGTTSMMDDIDEFVRSESLTNGWCESTVGKFETLKAHLCAFHPNLNYSDITDTFLSDYLDYIIETCGLRNSSALKHLALFRWFLRWAVKRGARVPADFMDFRPRLRSSDNQVVFLNWEELMRVYNFEGLIGSLDRVRDVFCFCAFTSLRYSDVANLKLSDISEDCIRITTVKTGDYLTIDLNKYSRAILDKYRDYAKIYGKPLPVISNQKMNDYLKKLMKRCGIDTPITRTIFRGSQRTDITLPKYNLVGTHTARRTFICNALSLGIPPQIVMKWTGHSDYKSMKPYIDIADNERKRAMALFDKRK
jgi:integrase